MIEIFWDIMFFLFKASLIVIVCYWLALKVCNRYELKKRRYLKILYTNIFCIVLFLIYGLLDNYCGIKNKSLAELWFVLFPVSIILIIVFSILLLIKKPGSQ